MLYDHDSGEVCVLSVAKGSNQFLSINLVGKQYFIRMKRNLVPYFVMLLKTLDTIGNCLRPVFSLGVSQHMHKIKNL